MRKFATCLALAAVGCFTLAAPITAVAAQTNAGTKAKGVHTMGASNISGWAIINADGTMAKGSNAVSSQHVVDAGGYEVIMNSKLTKCAFTATIGSAVPADPLPYDIIVSPRGGGLIKGVYVHVTDSGGTPAPAGFHVVVTC